MAKSSSGVVANGTNVGRLKPYEDIDQLRSADGIMAIISRRRATGVLTFAIFKEFERDGAVEQTQFISQNLAPSFLAMAQMVIERMNEINAEAVNKALQK